MMIGYHNRPDDTAECRLVEADGTVWQRTGDIGELDEDGFLTIVGRKKDMIISGGFNIYPIDIENVLATHTGIAEATVVGVPDERWGETPVAFVVLQDNGDAAEILAWANERLGRMQRLSNVVTIDTLPRGDIGKVLKRVLRDTYVASIKQAG
jgi:acyl-CoA synthetase (AMP-forming)/AMP-acid ligase II